MPKLIKDRLTIPDEIIKVSKVNVNKPIYFYKYDSVRQRLFATLL